MGKLNGQQKKCCIKGHHCIIKNGSHHGILHSSTQFNNIQKNKQKKSKLRTQLHRLCRNCGHPQP
uniref:Uncharacterized protein n=1 Tax=Anguilla anguilla TaxID=7936 RepID=A0A0E9WXH8_ANGAN